MMKNVHVGWGPVGLTRIVPNPTQITLKGPGKLEVGSTTTLEYTANIQGDISWQSSNTNIATIDKNGQLTAVGKGTVTITLTITKDGKEYKVTKEITVKLPYSAELKDKLANCDQPGDITLKEDVTASLEYTCGNKATLNLNGITLTGEIKSDGKVTDSYGLKVTNGTVTITDSEDNKGTIVAQDSDYSMAVWVTDDGTVNITGGTFKNSGDNCDLIYASGNGTINISGGYFEAAGSISGNAPGTKNPYSVLNVRDRDWKPENTGNAKIIVTGGIFKNFNPANNLSEGTKTNFVHPDFTVMSTTTLGDKNSWKWVGDTESYTSKMEDTYYKVIDKKELPETPEIPEFIIEENKIYLGSISNNWNPSINMTMDYIENVVEESLGYIDIMYPKALISKNPENYIVVESDISKPSLKEYGSTTGTHDALRFELETGEYIYTVPNIDANRNNYIIQIKNNEQ